MNFGYNYLMLERINTYISETYNRLYFIIYIHKTIRPESKVYNMVYKELEEFPEKAADSSQTGTIQLNITITR